MGKELPKKGYNKEMAKYQAKRFFNPASKRFWLTSISPLLLMGGSALESNTVDDFQPDMEQADQTMTENLDNFVADYISADQRRLDTVRAYTEGDMSGRDQIKYSWAINRHSFDQYLNIREYMFVDPRMTEQQFISYEATLDALDLGVAQDDVNPYMLKECRVKFSDGDFNLSGDRAVERCMADGEMAYDDEPEFKTFIGFVFSLTLVLLLANFGQGMGPTPRPDRRKLEPPKN